MKISISLLLLSLGLAFAAGYMALLVRQSDQLTIDFSATEINDLKRKFYSQTPPIAEIKFNDLFSAKAGFELLNPKTVYIPILGRTFSENASILKAEKSCDPDLITSPELNKFKIWLSYRCRSILNLPPEFFDQPPFMSPLGISFAQLAREFSAKFQTKDWTDKHIHYFHALELKSLSKDLTLTTNRKILSDLNADILLSMTTGQRWILSSEFLFVRKTLEAGADIQLSLSMPLPTADYQSYSRTDWDQFLVRYEVQTKNSPVGGCAYKDDGVCWSRASLSGQKIRWTIGILFFLSIVVIIFCVIQIIKNIQNQRFEDERKRFALQTLTHELRTPLASLVLSSEHVLTQFDQLPTPAKDPFLRMVDDIQRLTRVAESSQNYLKASEARKLVSFNFVEIPSLNEFVESVLDHYADEITLVQLENDISFRLDRYWVGMCLQNLVKNALQHGSKPVKVELKMEPGLLVLSVSDAGMVADLDLNTISKPFIKSAHSSGLGLGLSIVETVLNSMNSKLKITTKPTCFEMHIVGTQ